MVVVVVAVVGAVMGKVTRVVAVVRGLEVREALMMLMACMRLSMSSCRDECEER